MVPIRFFQSMLVVLLSGLVLAACASKPIIDSVGDASLKDVLQGRLLLTHTANTPAVSEALPDVDMMALDREIKDFVGKFLPKSELGRGFSDTGIENFVQAVFSPAMLGLDYSSSATYTAQETFARGNGNCLSVALLLTSMLRYAGNEVFFQEVMVGPNWERLQGENSFKVARHINVVSKTANRGASVIIDFNKVNSSIVNQQAFVRRTVRLTDKEVFAQYYNNLAVNFMTAGNKPDAFRYFRKALMLSPKDPNLWSNLGVLYRRYQHYFVAEAAFIKALQLDANAYTAMNNLASLYRTMGYRDKEQYYQAQITSWRNKNPYYRYALAREAFRHSHFIEAQKHLDFVMHSLKHPDAHVLDFVAQVEDKLHRKAVDERDI